MSSRFRLTCSPSRRLSSGAGESGSPPLGHRPSSQEFSLHNFLTCQQFLYLLGRHRPILFHPQTRCFIVNLKINLSSTLLKPLFPISPPSWRKSVVGVGTGSTANFFIDELAKSNTPLTRQLPPARKHRATRRPWHYCLGSQCRATA